MTNLAVQNVTIDSRLQKIKKSISNNEDVIKSTLVGGAAGTTVGLLGGGIALENIGLDFITKAENRAIERGWTEMKEAKNGIFSRPIQNTVAVPDTKNGATIVRRYGMLGVKKGLKVGLLITAAGATLGALCGSLYNSDFMKKLSNGKCL